MTARRMIAYVFAVIGLVVLILAFAYLIQESPKAHEVGRGAPSRLVWGFLSLVTFALMCLRPIILLRRHERAERVENESIEETSALGNPVMGCLVQVPLWCAGVLLIWILLTKGCGLNLDGGDDGELGPHSQKHDR